MMRTEPWIFNELILAKMDVTVYASPGPFVLKNPGDNFVLIVKILSMNPVYSQYFCRTTGKYLLRAVKPHKLD